MDCPGLHTPIPTGCRKKYAAVILLDILEYKFAGKRNQAETYLAYLKPENAKPAIHGDTLAGNVGCQGHAQKCG